MSRRVVVTGVGLVSALGIGTDANWHGLLAGQSGAGPITRFDASAFSTRFAAEVKGFDPLAFLEKKDVKKMDPFIHYAVAASQYAVDDARLAVTADNAARVGVFHREFAQPLYAVALWSEYCQTNKDGAPSSMWSRFATVMLAKCAEMLALRKAFPAELSGLYSAEEMTQAESEPKASA